MEYYPQLHRVPPSTLVESSHSRGEGSSHHPQEITLDTSVDGGTIYVLSSPPSTSRSAARSQLNVRSVRVVPSKQTPRADSSKETDPAAQHGSGMYEWERTPSPPLSQLSCKTDESIVEEWDRTARVIKLDGSVPEEEEEEDFLPASRWDIVPECQLPGAPRHTYFLRMHGRPLESHEPPAEPTHAHSLTRTPPPPPTPEPLLSGRFRLPLLSFFASLLSVDDSTLRLVTHLPAHSVILFPGPVSFPSDEGARGTSDSGETHGIDALLEPSSSQQRALRDGLAVVCDETILPSNPFGLSMSPLVGLLDIVRGVCVGSRASLREVW
ncbi:hypothetical protein BGW80DRAFT_1317339 [Lactifluus volemus]|nr:hypothetical protein BGW80DRAFT_1317339 [Lactifluus volemus]